MDGGITHVIRGDDHIRNTHKQLHLYRALQKAPPHFAHLPMIFGAKDGARGFPSATRRWMFCIIAARAFFRGR